MKLLTKLLGEIRRFRPRADVAGIAPAELRDLAESGRAQQAEDKLRRALESDPEDANAWHLLGLVHHLRGDYVEAARMMERAIAHMPDVAFFHANLAEVCAAMAALDQAERHYRRALQLSPDSAQILVGLARVIVQSGRGEEALGVARKALAADPGHAGALAAEAAILASGDRQPEAIARLKSSGALDPALQVRLFLLQAEICDWSQDRAGLGSTIARWAAAPRDPAFAGIHPFVAWHIDVPERSRLALTQGYTDRILAEAGSTDSNNTGVAHRARHGHQRRLRLGYLSADFHNHPTMHLMRGMFARHDRSRFDVYAYSLGPDDGSAYRRQVLADTEHFVDLRGRSPAGAAQRMHADAIDVLIDLKGFTFEAMPAILARRPAPVQLTWLGYPATIGSGLADYALVDRIVAPGSASGNFGEQLIRLPHCYQVNDDRQEIGAFDSTRADHGLPDEGIVYACFNNSYKIEPGIFDVWMRILSRLPASVLWLFRSNSWCEANLRREASDRGVDPGRLVYAGACPKSEHLARLRHADIVLDTRLINAHTGASDALWAGVPLVTCMGEGFPARVAASVLSAAGLQQYACATLQEYEELALRLAVQPAERAALREHLSSRRARLPLFDTARFVRNLESAVEIAWRRFARGQAPAHFDVADTAC